jgi:hypothetical protein
VEKKVKKRKRSKFKSRKRRPQFQNDAAPSALEQKPLEAWPRPPPGRNYFFREEVAAIIQLSTVTLWKYVRKGRISKPHKHGQRPIWYPEQIAAYYANLPECMYKPLEPGE